MRITFGISLLVCFCTQAGGNTHPVLSFRTRHSGTISVQATAAGPRSQLRLSLPVIPADDPVPPGCDVASPLLQVLCHVANAS